MTIAAGDLTEFLTFELNLIDPCSLASFIIDAQFIDSEIKYDVYETSTAVVRTLDPSLITLTTATTLCPDIEIDIVNADGTLLSDEFITYETETYEIRIETQDTEEVGDY